MFGAGRLQQHFGRPDHQSQQYRLQALPHSTSIYPRFGFRSFCNLLRKAPRNQNQETLVWFQELLQLVAESPAKPNQETLR